MTAAQEPAVTKSRGRPKRQRSASIDKGGSIAKADSIKVYDLNDPAPYEEDRHLLIQKISSLENKQLRGILPIVKEYQPSDDHGDEQKLEFDLYELSDRKLKELHNYVERCHQQNREAKQKVEQEKMIGEQMKVMMDEK